MKILLRFLGVIPLSEQHLNSQLRPLNEGRQSVQPNDTRGGATRGEGTRCDYCVWLASHLLKTS